MPVSLNIYRAFDCKNKNNKQFISKTMAALSCLALISSLLIINVTSTGAPSVNPTIPTPSPTVSPTVHSNIQYVDADYMDCWFEDCQDKVYAVRDAYAIGGEFTLNCRSKNACGMFYDFIKSKLSPDLFGNV